ncbi:MAG: polysaccharide deacetylase family protein [Candidatus Pacebacteria bacterium]|nr:polysaccharide deacetylase family protein [Candidatus Paceibacterota bacterium]PIR63737.1 MAG: alpha-amylase [Candidatus Pacebacteria bacterium CG10_big_fil_rev_8_21_14_0_10_40_26]PIZ78523.1 MAG: alpha-amylase [Candidatus Pacebacteria bacterium CG_4_10_14_0_2_um_filter_40_20]PJA69374.1 MAG: alpha-amylase [Candidatus Pacebacteria bacterium CG_4_9_14_3_um_filter_40_12]PJC41391.1 MAG: alpha-amylase [Candidatus Pacebacteria bacterium CG_4_9_14_0_2_um_filter_40_15]
MPKVCFYFQLHQPYRLADISVFDVGTGTDYFSGVGKKNQADDNKEIFLKVAEKSYRPMLTLLLKLVKKHSDFYFSMSLSGVFLEQVEAYAPDLIPILKKLAKSRQVEFLAETYYHSLAALYSPTEFKKQVQQHSDILFNLLGARPSAFRNTELIFNNDIAQLVEELGYAGMLTEGVDRYLWGRKRTVPYIAKTKYQLPVLLKHAQLSDDVAFRFSEKSWPAWPLTVKQYLEWIEVYPEEEIVNLFMDFETFGEHQWADTGIFTFFEAFVAAFLQKKWNRFVTPTQIFTPVCDRKIKKNCLDKSKLDTYDVVEPISWADVDRDITAWRDNPYQIDTLEIMYDMESRVLLSNDAELVNDWRRLQTSDHFYYMCTKWAADGDVHAYFSPYSDPHEAYRRFTIALADLQERLL